MNFENYSHIQLSQTGADVVIDLGNNQKLTLQNVLVSNLSANNFSGFLNQTVTLTGGSGNDNLYGDERDDVIDGQGGHDYIGGRQGNNVLTGGAGVDTFFIGLNPEKTDLITDFDSADEKISIQDLRSVTDVSQLTISYDGGDAHIHLVGNQELVLKNVAQPLTNDHFIFTGEQPFDVTNPVLGGRIYGTAVGDTLTSTAEGHYVDGRAGGRPDCRAYRAGYFAWRGRKRQYCGWRWI
ncbi:MAG: hypothetical protein IPN19_00025 [Elusimicrobia bacterium]|nr:hypothetical protein [Elusimicrobiota bacterium]